jgi:hypothetical protein
LLALWDAFQLSARLCWMWVHTNYLLMYSKCNHQIGSHWTIHFYSTHKQIHIEGIHASLVDAQHTSWSMDSVMNDWLFLKQLGKCYSDWAIREIKLPLWSSVHTQLRSFAACCNDS